MSGSTSRYITAWLVRLHMLSFRKGTRHPLVGTVFEFRKRRLTSNLSCAVRGVMMTDTLPQCRILQIQDHSEGGKYTYRPRDGASAVSDAVRSWMSLMQVYRLTHFCGVTSQRPSCTSNVFKTFVDRFVILVFPSCSLVHTVVSYIW